MLFHTLEFAMLFLAVLPLAIWGRSLTRRGALLLASYVFYAWFSIPLLSLMLFSSVLDHRVGLALHRSADQRRRRQLLLVSLVANLGLLFSFKYINWFFGSLNSLAMIWTGEPPLPHIEIILPLGISFYTFQTLSYTIDIYRRKLEPTQSLLSFSLYVAFFPQLVAGPIVRAAYLLPQLERGPRYGPLQLRWGLGIFMFGLVKKVVFADNFAVVANTVYADPASYAGWATLLGTYAFAFQIYCDFSGYTDMARGVAALLGYDIGLNFNFPYFSIGVRDFWRRWHISLSTWLRDYLYIPLGGNRAGTLMMHRNIMITMLLGGLWHGANWTFVVWGGLHGIWINIEHYFARRGADFGPRVQGWMPRLLATLVTFHLVCVTWIFFRADSVADALEIFAGLFRSPMGAELDLGFFRYLPLLLAVELLMWRTAITSWVLGRPFVFWILCLVGLLITLVLGDFRGNDFVYFQF